MVVLMVRPTPMKILQSGFDQKFLPDLILIGPSYGKIPDQMLIRPLKT